MENMNGRTPDAPRGCGCDTCKSTPDAPRTRCPVCGHDAPVHFDTPAPIISCAMCRNVTAYDAEAVAMRASIRRNRAAGSDAPYLRPGFHADGAHGNASADAGTGTGETCPAPYLVGKIAPDTLEAFIAAHRPAPVAFNRGTLLAHVGVRCAACGADVVDLVREGDGDVAPIIACFSCGEIGEAMSDADADGFDAETDAILSDVSNA